MISYQNIKRFDDVEFSEYLKTPAYSNSFLKSERFGISPQIIVTDNMRLGSMVDAIITEPHKVEVTSPFYASGREIAKIIMSEFGSLIEQFSKQVNFVGEVCYEENKVRYTMPTKGRLDFYVPKKAVIDLKVTSATNISSLVDFMGYDDQLWHYSRMSEVKDAFLIVYSRKLMKANLFHVPVDYESKFWKEKTIKFGKAEIIS